MRGCERGDREIEREMKRECEKGERDEEKVRERREIVRKLRER
jgi:hypothetical protein